MPWPRIVISLLLWTKHNFFRKNCRTKEGLKTIFVSHGAGKASQCERGLKNPQNKPRTVNIKVVKKERNPVLRSHTSGTCVKNMC